MDTTKGVVYFFKIKGLTPIKIGYTANSSCKKRFMHLMTFAPYGAEVVGFIDSDNAHALEKELHEKFSDVRLNGEWFEITKEDVYKLLDEHRSDKWVREHVSQLSKDVVDVTLDNFFVNNPSFNDQTDFVNTITLGEYSDMYYKIKDNKDTNYKKNLFFNYRNHVGDANINKNKVAKQLHVSRTTIYAWLKETE